MDITQMTAADVAGLTDEAWAQFAALEHQPLAFEDRILWRRLMAARRPRRRVADPAETEVAMVRAGGGRFLEGAWERMTLSALDVEAAEVDAVRLQASLTRSAEDMARMVQRAQEAASSGRVTHRRGEVPAKGSGWGDLVQRAFAEQAHPLVGGPDPNLAFAVDPEDAEDERLRREGGQVVARYGQR